MDAADLKVFEAVARTGSMNKATAVLHTVQSNVTARIQALEAELGLKLFERDHRGAVLTPAGRRLLPFATRAVHLFADAKRAAADEGTPSGALVLGSLESTAAVHLAPIFAEYVAANPAVDLTFKTGTTCELVEQVLNRQVDGAFVCGPVKHPHLLVEPFAEEELVLLTGPNILRFGDLVATPDFRIIVLRAGCSYRLRLEAMLARRGIVGFRVSELGTLETIFGCVSAGLGVTLLPKAMLGSVWPKTRVRSHSLPDGEGLVETVFIRHRESYTSSALRSFLDVSRPMRRQLGAAE
jgi:DNA-binding transcriptional LysR family regulator